jgi:hypothetical protein
VPHHRQRARHPRAGLLRPRALRAAHHRPAARAARAANAYYEQLTGLPTDQQCKNPTRISALAHDPDVYFNPDALPVTVPDTDPAPTAKRTGSVANANAARAAVTDTDTLHAALKQQLADKGVVYTTGYHNAYISRLGYLCNLYGLPLEEALTWAGSEWPDYGEANLRSVFTSCYGNTAEFGTRTLGGKGGKATAKGAAAPRAERYATVAEIEAFLAAQGEYRYNIITRRIEMRGKDEKGEEGDNAGFHPLADRDVRSLWRELCKQVKPARTADVYAVIGSDFVPAFDPIRSYFRRIKPWDGVTDHIARVAATIVVEGDRERFAEWLRKWLVALVAAYFDPDVVNHEILVLIGLQGSYKTTWFQHLLPPELRPYFYTKVHHGHLSKDDLLALSEFWIVCLEEIDLMSAADLNTLKAMVTMNAVDVRAAYDRTKEHRLHIASFCGTGNNEQFLTDPTGNRRWLACKVLSIADPYTTDIPHDGLFAQAYALWQQGFRYWFDAEETAALNRHNARFEAVNIEEEQILTWYRRPEYPGEGIFVTTADIIARIGANLKQPMSAQKVGIAMTKLGFESKRRGKGLRGYIVVEYTMEQVLANRHLTREPDATDQKLPF